MNFKSIIKGFIPQIVFNNYNTLKVIVNNFKFVKNMNYNKWQSAGRPLPPPHVVKQNVIREYCNSFKPETMIETGTYLGQMVYSQLDNFKKIISIELSKDLHTQAVKRFKKYKNVKLLSGDSSEVLSELAKSGELNMQCLFWLDGHYSAGFTALGNKETPILEELETILGTNQKHIILIDDARCFVGENDYPTIEELRKYIINRNSEYSISVKDDIIRVVPNS